MASVGAGLFAEPSGRTAGEVDPEPWRPTTSVGPLGGLHGNTTHRANSGEKITAYTPFFSVRIAGQDNPGPGAGRQGTFIFGVGFGDRFSKKMFQDGLKSFDQFRQGIFPYLL